MISNDSQSQQWSGKVLVRLCLVILISLFARALGGAAAYPVKVSGANPRLLVDQGNSPFMLVGDSPHALIVNLTVADAARYFDGFW